MGQVPQAYQKASGSITDYNNKLKDGKVTEQYIQRLEKKDKVFGEWIKSLNGSEASMEGYNAHLEKMGVKSALAEAGMTALTGALNVGAMVLADMALQAIASAIDEMVHAQENAIKTFEENAASWENQRKNIQATGNTLDSIIPGYQLLSDGVDQFGQNLSLSTEAYGRYQQIANQIADLFPQLVSGYTAEGNAILKNKGSIEELTKAYQEMVELENKKIVLQGSETFEGYKQAVDHEKLWSWEQDGLIQQQELAETLYAKTTDRKELEKFLKPYGEDLKEGYTDTTLKSIFDSIGAKYDDLDTELSKVVDDVLTRAGAINDHIDILKSQIDLETIKIKPLVFASLELDDNYKNMSSDTQNIIKALVGEIDAEFYRTIDSDTNLQNVIQEKFVNAFKGFDGQKLSNAFNEMFDWKSSLEEGKISIGEYQQKLQDFFSNNQLNDEMQGLASKLFNFDAAGVGLEEQIQSVKDKMQDAFKDDIDNLSLEDLRIAYELENVGDLSFDDLMVEILKFKNAAREPVSLGDSVSGLISEFDELRNAMDKVNEGQTLSLDEITSLLQKYPDLEKSLIKTKDGYTLQKGALDTLYESKLADKQLDIEKSAEQAKAVLDSSKIIAGAKDMETDAVIAALKAKIIEKSLSGSDKVALTYHTTGQYDPNAGAETDPAEVDKLNTLLQTLENSVADRKGIDFYLNYNRGNSSRVNNPSGSSTSSVDTWLEAYNEKKADLDYRRKMGIISEEDYLNELIALNDKYFKGREKYQDQYRNNLVEIRGLEQSLTKDKISGINDEISALEKEENTYDQQLDLVYQQRDSINAAMEKARADGISIESEYYKSLEKLMDENLEKEKSIIDAKREYEQKAFLEDIDASKERISSYKESGHGEISGELMVEEAEQAMKAINERIEELRGEDSEANKEYIKELQKQYKELDDSRLEGLQMILDAEKKQIDESISAAREALEKERKATEEYWNEEIKAYKRKHEAQEKVNTLKEKELQLENLKKQRNVLTYMEGQGFVYTADTEAVDAAQEDLDKTREEYEYQAQLQRMEDAKERALQAIDDELAKLDEQQEFWDQYFEDFELNSATAQSIHEDWVKNQGEQFVKQTDNIRIYSENYTKYLQDMIDKMRELNALEGNAKIKTELGGSSSSKERNSSKGYASGSAYVSNSGTYLVNENGPEAIFKPGLGTYEYLPQGTVVFSAAATKNLWNWSKLNPARTLSASHFPTVAAPQVNSISIGDVILNGVQDTDRLSREIVDRLPLAMQQEFYKR